MHVKYERYRKNFIAKKLVKSQGHDHEIKKFVPKERNTHVKYESPINHLKVMTMVKGVFFYI